MLDNYKSLWFKIAEGKHIGEWHLRGWMLSAFRTKDGWLAFAVCPRCNVMVLSDDKHAFGDRTWNHEQWHAATDYPIPSEGKK